MLPPESPEPGRWRTDRIPYFKPIFEAFSDPTVREIVIVCGSQMGKSEALLCVIGHRFTDGPLTPAIIVQPNMNLAGSFADDRLRKLFSSTPELDAKLEKGNRDRKHEKFISGVRLGMAWAGSATSLSSWPCGLALVDERDRMDADVQGEGDPVTLVRARGKNYPRFKLGIVSTPTIEDTSPIQARFDDGTMEFWEWCCPHCGDWFWPRLKHLTWPQGCTAMEAEELGTFHCPACGAQIADRHKRAMNENGRYRGYERTKDGDYQPSPTPRSGSIRSFWISGLCSPWVRFGAICSALVGAYRSGDVERIQAVVNTYGGEVFRTRGDAPEWQEVAALKRTYGPYHPPPGVQGVTMGVDVQKLGLYYMVRGWGFNMTSWLLGHGFIAGETAYDDVWIKLANQLMRPIGTFRVQRCFVDSGEVVPT